MRIYVYLVSFLYVNSVFSFTLNQVMERLTYINDRVDTESKFRRDDFNTLFNEIGSLKAMIQQSLENKAKGQDADSDMATDKTYSDLEEKIQLLTNGFKEEKQLNIRFRREIPELQRHVQDLKTKTDQISLSLMDILKGIEFLKDQKREREEAHNIIENDIPEIKGNVLNVLEQFEQAKNVEVESLNRIKNDTEKMKENIEYLKHTHELCLVKMNTNDNITKRLEEKLVSGEMHDNAEKDSSKTEHQERKCNCSISSFSEKSTPSPSIKMPSYKSCLELRDNAFDSDGIYTIEIEHEGNIAVYCDMTTDGGGWTVFQRRQDGSVDFFRGWEEYETGFGNLSGEFWLGNRYLNLLTDNDEPHELRIELGDHEGNNAYAKYSSFKIMSKSEKFKIAVSGYKGNAGDSLPSSGDYPSDQMEFSTKDNDNDKDTFGSCASYWAGAWWFNRCFYSHLNGLYQDTSTCIPTLKCIIWNTWKGSRYSLKFTEMKFR